MINVRNTGVILAAIIFIAILWYARVAHTLIAGALYLVIASSLDLTGILLGLGARRPQRRTDVERDVWLVQIRSSVLISSAWQFAVIGLLNIWAYEFSGSTFTSMLCYASVGVFVVVLYKQIALADSPLQHGGGKLLNYFGRRRSRKLLFVVFFVYPVLPFLAAGLGLFFRKQRYPIVFDPPNLCLEVISIASLVSAALIYQRYNAELHDNQLRKAMVVIVSASLIVAAVLVFVINYGWHLYFFSAIAEICLATNIYCLFSARANSEVSI